MKATPLILEFLRESNAIEGVYDERSFVDAKEAWKYIIQRKKIKVKHILELHRILMQRQPLEPEAIGAFRKVNVRVGSQPCPHPIGVPSLMKEWLEDFKLKPFGKEEVKEMHVRFEKIHPFVDGNGRMGRILLNYQRVKQLGVDPLVIRETQRQDYYQWFK